MKLENNYIYDWRIKSNEIVLIINDGSNEKYDPIFKAASKYAQLEGYKINRGKGSAMKYGYSIIQEDYPEAKYIITCLK